jgi:hypothetical protein
MWLPVINFRQAAHAVCFFGVAFVLLATVVGAQHKGNRLEPRYLSDAPADPARGIEIMQQFRSLGLPGDYYLEFDLEILPRTGKKSTVPGQMWGSYAITGPVFRAQLSSGEGEIVDRLLGRNGAEPQAWRWSADDGADQAQPLTAETLLDPVGGTELSMFELQMPFIYWDDFVYEGTDQVRGRAVQSFLMYPPADFAAAHPEIQAVRLHLDAKFSALMQAVFLGADEEVTRKLSVMDLKKLGDQWIVKTIDVRDEATRDKVRFKVTAAALDLDLAPGLFEPAALGDQVERPAGVERLGW